MNDKRDKEKIDSVSERERKKYNKTENKAKKKPARKTKEKLSDGKKSLK